MLQVVAFAAFGLSCLVYFGLTVRAAFALGDAPARRSAILACGVSGVWAGAMVVWLGGIAVPPWVIDLGELARDLAWIHLLLVYMQQLESTRPETPRRVLVLRVMIPVALLLGGLLTLSNVTAGNLAGYFRIAAVGGKILVSALGLWLIEMAVVRSGPSRRWGVKHLALALAAVFGFDLYFYSDILLVRGLDPDLVIVRGVLGLLIAPLLWVSIQRMRSWSEGRDPRVNVSPRAAIQGMALIASGLYLLVMAGLASAIQEAGGQWGNSLQAVFMIGVVLLMFVAIGSGRFKSQVRVLLHKYFFTYKYDYREEWRRFIRMMGAHEALSLGERIIRSMADLVDSPAGALWLWQRVDDAFIPDAAWNYRGARPAERGDSPFIQFLRDTGWVIEKNGPNPPGQAEPEIPAWLTDHAALWLLLPLIHRGQVLGFVALDQARAPRHLDWEDRDLLKTVGAHAASYLAEELAAEALSESHKIAEFNRRFAFVVHDIKNVVGQMSLIVENAERHGDNPEFREDMMRTVANSVERLKAMLAQLSERRRAAESPAAPVDLRASAAAVEQRWRAVDARFGAELPPRPVVALAVDENFVAALDLLIDNALGAIGPEGRVVLRLRAEDGKAIAEIEDDGPGMDQDFVYKELFRPLRSTKSGGYGIGGYQTRQLIRDMGGKLEVDSAPNRGTIMRILLPLEPAGAGVPLASE